MTQLRRTPLHRALYRPTLLMGGEREPVLVTGIIAGTLIVVVMTWPATLIGLVTWFFCLWALRRMGKADPYMSKVYLRQLKYQGYYAPRSRHWRVD